MSLERIRQDNVVKVGRRTAVTFKERIIGNTFGRIKLVLFVLFQSLMLRFFIYAFNICFFAPINIQSLSAGVYHNKLLLERERENEIMRTEVGRSVIGAIIHLIVPPHPLPHPQRMECFCCSFLESVAQSCYNI